MRLLRPFQDLWLVDDRSEMLEITNGIPLGIINPGARFDSSHFVKRWQPRSISKPEEFDVIDVIYEENDTCV
jgi:hypothetical protein